MSTGLGQAVVPVRTLPIRVVPGVGEGLDSYLERLAHRSGAAWADILDAVGLDTGGGGGGTAVVYRWLCDLSATQQQSLSGACGIDPTALRRLTMAALIPSAEATPPETMPTARPYLSPSRSRFCPHCLQRTGGRWQLWWRLRWAFACPRHRCLLADACPECGRWQKTSPLPGGLIPVPGCCARTADTCHGPDLRRCGATLSTGTTLNLTPQHPVLAVQSALLATLRRGVFSHGVYAGNPVSVRQYLLDLTALGARILGYADLSDLDGLVPADLLDAYRCARTAPPSREHRGASLGHTAVATAVAAVLAVDVLSCRDTRAAGQHLRWLVAASRRRGLAVTASNIGWSRHVERRTARRAARRDDTVSPAE